MATVKYKGKRYRYSTDFSWKKWIKILNEGDRVKIVDWYYDNVLIDKPMGYKDVNHLVAALRNKFEHTHDQIRDIMRNSAKVVRGINLDKHQDTVIIFNLMYELHMDYIDVTERIPWQKVLFFHGMITEVKRLEKEANDRNRRK